MKITLFTAILFTFCSAAHAQLFDKLKKKAEDKIEKAADKILNEDQQKDETEAQKSNTTGSKVTSVFDFAAGDSVIFQDDFSAAPAGSMPGMWKSSGTGEVATFSGAEGKWLSLTEFTTYKLDTLLAMPENFSLEFDILTRADQAKDLNNFSFGFALDNSVSSYISDAYNDNAISNTQIHYWNEEVTNSSSDTEIYNTQDLELASYANAVMHVSIQVTGEKMKVYLDQEKVLDTRMFDPGVKKYFYMSTSTRIDNEARIAIGNFKLAE